MFEMFETMYTPDEIDKERMGEGYNPPARFPHNQPQMVAMFAAAEEEGQPTEVYETRCPASFFKIVVHPTVDSPGYTLETGSDMGKLAMQIARAIADGMLALDVTGEADHAG